MAVLNIRGFIFLTMVCILIVLFPLARRSAQTRTGTPGLQRATARPDGGDTNVTKGSTVGRFIIYRGKNGPVCRQMTPAEVQDLSLDDREQATINLSGNLSSAAQQQTGLKITLRGTSQLQNNPSAQNAFLRAAAKWEAMVQSPISIVIDVDFGATLFGEPYESADIIGSSDAQALFSSTIYSSVRNSLIAGASTPQQTAIFGGLPVGSVPTDSGNTSGTLTSSANFRALGLINATANPATENANFGPPPSIGFNSAFPYDFDPSDGIDADKVDFEAAALHEIGHVLGFLSWVGAREVDPAFPLATSLWDLYRVRTGTDLTTFTSSRRFLLSGGEQFFFSGLQEQPLSTGRPDGTGGDEEQASHWKDDFFVGALVGVMDPTLANGRRSRVGFNDLEALSLFGYRINPTSTVFDEYSADDGSVESAISGANAMFVNRFTANRYPAKLETVRVRFFIASGAPSPVGSSLRVVVFSDPQRTGEPPASPTLLYDQSITVGAIPNSRFLEIPLSNGPTINSGDIYVGIQSSSDVRFGGDVNGKANHRSFVSLNNGASFAPLRVVSGGEVDVNLMTRAEISSTFGNVPTPTLDAISPATAAPGEPGITLFVNGRNFQPNSVVRWNNSDRVTTLVSGNQLRATIPASDLTSPGTAQVTVVTPGAASLNLADAAAVEATSLTFTITANRPIPTLTRLDPNLAAAGTNGLLLSVAGTNFTSGTVLRWNGGERATTVTNSVKLSAVITGADLASEAGTTVTVFTPGPGGGESNPLSFSVTACSYDLSSSSLTFLPAGGTNGVTLNTASPCAWTAQSSVPWLTLGTTGGVGKAVITFQIAANTSTSLRSGLVTIGGRQLPVRQLGVLTSVSAASFSAPLAPGSIAAAFGAGLANETTLGNSVPLPTNINGTSITVTDANSVTRTAGLFFASPNQINFLVPVGTASGTASVTTFSNGVSVAYGNVTISSVAPGIFTANNSGLGVPAAYVLRIRNGVQTQEDLARFDTVQNKFVTAPIDFGPAGDQLFLVLFGTGIRGLTSTAAATVKVGDVAMPVTYAGPQSSFIGQDQVNIELQRSLIGKGEVSVILTVNGRSANVVTVNFK